MVIEIGLFTNDIFHWTLFTSLKSMKMVRKTLRYKNLTDEVVYISMKYNDIFNYTKSGNKVHAKNYNSILLIGSSINFNP